MSENTQHPADGRGKGQARKAKNTKRTKKKRAWPWIVLGVLAVLVAVPVALFAYAYAQYEVPEPEELTNKQISTIYASDSTTQLARIVPPEGNRTQVTLDQIPDYVENAALAAEDREFWTNSGFSVTGFGRAAIGELTGNPSAGGGSTITQQYVKNTLVGNERSYVRKARELIYSIKMTNQWSKEDILKAYFNTVYFGRNAYGIQAASVAYFDKSVEDLTVEEGALLAGLIQAPSALDPRVDPAAAEARWNYVLDGLVEMGEITPDQRAQMTMPETRDPSEYSAYTEATGANGHIKNQVVAELAKVGITEEDINTRGLKITTTIDMGVQNASVEAVDDNLAPLQEDARAASVTIDPSTGAVRGYFGGHDPNGWDYANAPLQTGSTFKIMALAAALQQGIDLNTMYSSDPFQLPGSKMVNNWDGTGCGICSIETALKHSYNTSFLRLQEDLENRMNDTADMAHALGVAESLPGIEKTLYEDSGMPYEGIVLGQYQSRVLDMATAVATLADRGIWHDTYFVQKVETNSGEVLYEHPNDGGERRVSAQVADNVIKAMEPIAAYSNGALAGGRESAAKTGTAQLGDTGNNKDTWMVGATPQLATAVWVGTADNTSAIFNEWGGNMYGSGTATQIWKQTLDASLADAPFETFPTATPVRYGNQTAGTWYDPSWNSAPTWDSGAGNTATGTSQAQAPSTDPNAPGNAPSPAPDANGNGGNNGNGNGGNGGNGNGGNGNGNPAPNPNPEPAPAPAPAPQPPSLEDLLGDTNLQDIFG